MIYLPLAFLPISVKSPGPLLIFAQSLRERQGKSEEEEEIVNCVEM